MPKTAGIRARAAMKRALTWGLPERCGAGDGILALPCNITEKCETIISGLKESEYEGEQGCETSGIRFSLPAHMRYEGLDLPIALVLGSTGGTPVRQGLTSAYMQTFKPALSVDGFFATFAMDNGMKIHECPSLKLFGFTLGGQTGRPLAIGFDCIADALRVDSMVNTPLSFQSVDFPPDGGRVLMSQGVFRMNESMQGGLGPADVIRPSSFELRFRRSLAGERPAGSHTDTIDEPANIGPAEATLALRFARYAELGLLERWELGSQWKLDIIFTGASIDVGHSRSLRLVFPKLAPLYEGFFMENREQGLMFEFACLEAASSPEGMEGVSAPFHLSLVNTLASDVLG